MSYSYPLAFPTGVRGLQQIHLTAQSVTAVGASPFTLSQQVQVFPGQQWLADCKLAPMKRVDAEVWNAFFLKLNGFKGTFLMGDPLATSPQGLGTGTPKVNGGTQAAGSTSLITDGWPNSTNNLLLPGDYFHMVVGSNQRLHKVLSPVNSDSSGNATIDIWPYLRESPADDAVLVLTNAQGQFRLSTPTNDWTEDTGGVYTLAFGTMEAL